MAVSAAASQRMAAGQRERALAGFYAWLDGGDTNATFANRTTAVCARTTNTATTVMAKSIGTGLKPAAAAGAVPAGQLSAALCTTATLGGADPSTYTYADGVNFTPAMQSLFYSQALARMRLAAWIN